MATAVSRVNCGNRRRSLRAGQHAIEAQPLRDELVERLLRLADRRASGGRLSRRRPACPVRLGRRWRTAPRRAWCPTARRRAGLPRRTASTSDCRCLPGGTGSAATAASPRRRAARPCRSPAASRTELRSACARAGSSGRRNAFSPKVRTKLCAARRGRLAGNQTGARCLRGTRCGRASRRRRCRPRRAAARGSAPGTGS